jgi:hypothetical protein
MECGLRCLSKNALSDLKTYFQSRVHVLKGFSPGTPQIISRASGASSVVTLTTLHREAFQKQSRKSQDPCWVPLSVCRPSSILFTQHDAEQPDRHPSGSACSGSDANGRTCLAIHF